MTFLSTVFQMTDKINIVKRKSFEIRHLKGTNEKLMLICQLDQSPQTGNSLFLMATFQI